jgi:UDP-2,3-diacylglucosamine pyrophosphatase LpxH
MIPHPQEAERMMDAVILSDIHLGSDNCQAKNVVSLLERVAEGELPTARVILNGDVFDSIDFRRLNKHHWKVLSLLRKLSDDLEITWLCGNHDGSAEIISHLLGVRVMDEFVLESGPARILILHGHVFDDFLDSHPILTWMADCVYCFLQWIDSTHYFAKLAKRGSKTFLRCAKKIEDCSVEHARRKGCTVVCCGHTHAAVARENEHVSYYNSGCWTELPCHYLTVRDGVVQLHAYADVVRTPVVEAEGEVCADPSPAAETDPVAYAIP